MSPTLLQSQTESSFTLHRGESEKLRSTNLRDKTNTEYNTQIPRGIGVQNKFVFNV